MKTKYVKAYVRSISSDEDTMQIHPDVLGFTVNAKGKPSSVEQLEARLLKPPVVATTALSIDQYVIRAFPVVLYA